MTTPKNPEEIINSAQMFIMEDDSGLEIREKFYALPDYWLRSSMASLLLYMAERMPAPGSFFTNSEYCGDCEHIFKRQEEQYQKDCIAVLTNEARKITEV